MMLSRRNIYILIIATFLLSCLLITNNYSANAESNYSSNVSVNDYKADGGVELWVRDASFNCIYTCGIKAVEEVHNTNNYKIEMAYTIHCTIYLQDGTVYTSSESRHEVHLDGNEQERSNIKADSQNIDDSNIDHIDVWIDWISAHL